MHVGKVLDVIALGTVRDAIVHSQADSVEGVRTKDHRRPAVATAHPWDPFEQSPSASMGSLRARQPECRALAD